MGKAAQSRRLRSLVAGPGSRLQTMEIAPGRHASGDERDELVRILTKLTRKVERFDDMVALQRELIEQRALQTVTVKDDPLSRQAERLNDEARDMVTYTRQVLEELRRLSR